MLDFESKPAPKISGSIDIQVEIEPVEFDDMANRPHPRPQDGCP